MNELHDFEMKPDKFVLKLSDDHDQVNSIPYMPMVRTYVQKSF